MDVHYELEGVRFVWNAQKALQNYAKHGVSFESGCEVFFDRLATLADASVPDETRFALIGTNGADKLLCVVHVEREDEAIRIISAREVDAREQKLYENGR
jgi:uncharacterized DUF497 family protein